MTTYDWYQTLVKPPIAPPAWIFGPVWTALYAIIAVSFGTVFYKIFTKQLPVWMAAPFVLNLIFNAAFTPLQFGLRSNVLASIDILLVLVTLIWSLLAIYPHMRWIALVNIPYLLWVSFATVLQLWITILNR